MHIHLDADLRATHGGDTVRILAAGSSLVLSVRSPFAAWRLRRAVDGPRTLDMLRDLAHSTGLSVSVRVMGLRVWRAGGGK